MSIASAIVAKLQSVTLAVGDTDIFADKMWEQPAPGQSVVVVQEIGDWASARNTSEHPTVRVTIYSANSEDQEDSELLGEPIARQIRHVLHVPYNIREWFDNEEVLSITHVGSSGPYEVEGHDSWAQRSLTFELLISGSQQAQILAMQEAARQAAQMEKDRESAKSQKFLESEIYNRPLDPEARRTIWKRKPDDPAPRKASQRGNMWNRKNS